MDGLAQLEPSLLGWLAGKMTQGTSHGSPIDMVVGMIRAVKEIDCISE
jgi:uncharacterized membrane protein YeaQ/YmgE (transglycosylase-associated protein family)